MADELIFKRSSIGMAQEHVRHQKVANNFSRENRSDKLRNFPCFGLPPKNKLASGFWRPFRGRKYGIASQKFAASAAMQALFREAECHVPILQNAMERPQF